MLINFKFAYFIGPAILPNNMSSISLLYFFVFLTVIEGQKCPHNHFCDEQMAVCEVAFRFDRLYLSSHILVLYGDMLSNHYAQLQNYNGQIRLTMTTPIITVTTTRTTTTLHHMTKKQEDRYNFHIKNSCTLIHHHSDPHVQCSHLSIDKYS